MRRPKKLLSLFTAAALCLSYMMPTAALAAAGDGASERAGNAIQQIAAQISEGNVAVQASGATVENAVAEVTVDSTTTQYDGIDEAFAAAQKAISATVKLLADVTINHVDDTYGIVLNRGQGEATNFTLDLNGKTISQKSGIPRNSFYPFSAVFYLADGSLTIQDSSGDKSGKIVQPNGGHVIAAIDSTLTVESGTIENTSSENYITEAASVHMTPNCAIWVWGGTVSVNGGTLSGINGVMMDSGSLTVTGGTFTGTSGNALIVYDGTAKLSGGSFNNDVQQNDHSIWVADGKASDLLVNGYRYESGGKESSYSENGNGVAGNTEVKQRPANEYAYIDANGKERTQANCTEITEKTDDIAGPGWYAVKENVTISSLNISGQINLILCDEATLTVSSVMNVTTGVSLNLYWQSAGSGKLMAKAVLGEDAVIAPAGEMKKTAGENGTTFEKCLIHDWGYGDNKDDTHTAKCKLCGKEGGTTAHSYTDWSSNGADTHTGTCVCGAESTENHTMTTTPNTDGLTHTSRCDTCGYTAAAESHSFSIDDEYGKKCACGAYLTASYNGQNYATLTSAVAAAVKAGGTVTLQKNIAENITIADGMTVTVDLGGKNWTHTNENGNKPALTVNGGSIAVKNGTIRSGTMSGAYYPVEINGGHLTVGENMTINGGSTSIEAKPYYPAIEVQGGELILSVGTKLLYGMKAANGKTLADYLPEGTAFEDGNGIVNGYVQEKVGNFTLTVAEHAHNDPVNLACACGAKIAASVMDSQQSTVYGWYTTLEEAFASVESGEERFILVAPGTHTLGKDTSIAGSIVCGPYNANSSTEIEVEYNGFITVENGGFLGVSDGLHVSAVKVKNGGSFDSGGVVGVLSLEDDCKTFQNSKLTRGIFNKIVIDNNKKLSDALHSEGLGQYTFRHTDNTWATDEELAGTEIENVSVVKKPFKDEKITVSPGSELSYQSNLEVVLTAEKEDQGDYGDTTYEWFATDNPTQVLSNEAAYTRVLSEAGSYTLECRITRGGYAREVLQEIVVKKGTATCTTEPQVVTNLIYNGSAQNLVTAGAANGGTMQYSPDGTNCSADIPTGTDAKEYTVWYKAVGDSNHNDSEAQSLSVTIAPKTVDSPTIEVASGSTYNSQAQEPAITVKDGDAVIDPSEYAVSYSNNINAGEATVVITDKDGGNYSVNGSKNFSIVKAAGSVIAPVAKTLTYNGEDQELVSAAISETGTVEYSLDNSNVWQESIPAAKDAGKYTVHYKVAGDSNHNDVAAASVTVTITPAPATITVKDKSVYVGDTVPSLSSPKEGTDYEVSGLMGKDELTTAPVLKYVGITDDEPVVPDTSKAGEAARIAASGADAGGNYEFTYAPGKLTVSNRPVVPSPVPDPKPSDEPVSITLENNVVDGAIIIKNMEDTAHENAPIKVAERFEEFEKRLNRSLFDIIDKIMKNGYNGLGPDNFRVVNSVPLKDLESLAVDIEYKAEQYADNHDAESSLHPLAQASNDLSLGDGYELDGDAYTIQIAVKAGDKLIGYLTGFDLTVAYEAPERDASYTYTLLGGKDASYDSETGTYTFTIASGDQFAVAKIANATLDKRALAKVSGSKTVKVKAGKGAKLQLKAVTSESGNKVSYKKKSGSKKVKVSKSGKVTIAKGLKPGKKYLVTIKATVGKATKTIKLTIRVAKAKKTKK